ncbi:MAG TPA: alpha/beta fold hydrolase [Thiobacillaceae bacterium]|nr:alpha/beta fold hydrolase [Thiobacillaceae bacterium]
MRLLSLIIALLLAVPVLAADYAREKKWAEEVLPAVLTGDPVWLELGNGHKYLTLYTEAANAKAGVIVVHGMGVHPDWGLIAPLRQRLPDMGYATLSVQMPVLKAEAKGEDYPATFDEAAERLAHAVAFMKAKGYKKIVLVTHSMGCRMTARYLEKNPGADVAAWVAIGAPASLDYSKLKIPVFDLYGENDLPAVLEGVKARAKGLSGNKKSAQSMAPKADHFFEGKDEQLLVLVKDFLDKAL